jgi:hypothetical protein
MCLIMSSITCSIYQILLGNYIKEDGMGRACGTHGRDAKYIQRFGWKT